MKAAIALALLCGSLWGQAMTNSLTVPSDPTTCIAGAMVVPCPTLYISGSDDLTQACSLEKSQLEYTITSLRQTMKLQERIIYLLKQELSLQTKRADILQKGLENSMRGFESIQKSLKGK